ncbi:hypothetical protein GCM10023345_23010 [Acinetobacter kookii]|uniref:hypothetical protein n=1 Tax=Acinetobacter kookii TaxID=1226327 RepID=UPI00148A40A0|nr:hypothetical protein [Acinetobacter kookii]
MSDYHLITQKNTKVELDHTFLQNNKIPINIVLFVSKEYGDNMENEEKQQAGNLFGVF